MKKSCLVILTLLLVFSVFGMQQSFNASDYEYQQLFSLCRAAGIETVQLVAPISADQMLAFIKTIPAGSLNSSEQKVLNDLVNHLENPYMLYGKDDYGFDACFTACPDIFMHTAKEAVPIDESVEERRYVLPMMDLEGDVYFSDYFFGHFEFGTYLGDLDRKSNFSHNFNFKGFNVQLDTPYKAYTSFGKNKFNFTIGRNRLSLGHGKTGNLSLGDNFLFEDFAKISYFNNLMSYDMTMITFDLNDSYSQKKPLNFAVNNHNDMARNLVVVHQFSFKPFKWLNISVNEGMLQYGKELFSDFSIVNPFMLMHNINTYIAGTANNFFGVDIAVAFAKGWEVNASLFFDQIQQKQELYDGKPGENTPPNANAFLLNIVHTEQILGGMADFYVEGVYTNPAVYLKEKANAYKQKYTNYYDLDLIVGNALSGTADSDVHYLGYKYGPDTIAVATGFDYTHEKLQLSFDAMFKIHGKQGMRIYENQQDYNDVGVEAFYAKTPTYVDGVTRPEKRLSFELDVIYRPFDWLTVNSEIGLITAWDYHNEIGRRFNDMQFAIGVKINPLHIAKHAYDKYLAK